MKRLATSIGLWTLWIAIMYLGFGFTMWNFDPATWTEGARGTLAFMAFAGLIPALGIGFEIC